MGKLMIDLKEMKNLRLFIDEIVKMEILLPDFQRGYVWDLENQKRLVASVLTRLPIGSLLLLEARGNEFVSKKIGRKDRNSDLDSNDYHLYLLDGQQRITTLVNVFSNAIFKDLTNWKHLIADSLKNRFFIKLEGLKSDEKFDDLFGVRNLKFPFDPKIEEPSFSTNEIFSYIDTQVYNKDDDSSLHPMADLSEYRKRLDAMAECIDEKKDVYRIPLFLVAQNHENLLRNIIDKIANIRVEEMVGKRNDGCTDDILELFPDAEQYLNDRKEFVQFIHDKGEDWSNAFVCYLMQCVENLKLEIMSVSYNNRGRAIDIYENLNKGGISLNNFDLIIAKAAIKEKDFYNDFCSSLAANLDVPEILRKGIRNFRGWNAADNMHVISGKMVVSKTYINVFLNLLSIISNLGHRKVSDKSTTEIMLCMKKSKILDLTPQEIADNYKNVIAAINRALAFLQFRCGLISISNLPYDHLLLGIAYILFDEDLLQQEKYLNILEAWYLSSIFSKTYDSDQNQRIALDLKELDNLINHKGRHDFLDSRFENVFNSKYFDDLDTLMMKNDGFIPKKVIQTSICNYILSKHPYDFIEDTLLTAYNVSLNDDSDNKLQIHHIFPLKNGKTIRINTKELRNKKDDIYNSPLNLTYILESSNYKISNCDAQTYLGEVKQYALRDHFIDLNEMRADDIEPFLISRFKNLKADMDGTLRRLMEFEDTGDDIPV